MKKSVFASLFLLGSLIISSCGSVHTYSRQSSQPLDSNSQTSINSTSSFDNRVFHNVTFDSAGGSPVETQQVEHGEKIIKPANPTRPGYTFIEWTYEGETWSFIGYVVTQDMTLTANWEIVDYVATFVNYDGEVLEVQENVHYGDQLTFHEEEPHQYCPDDGYLYYFDGWDQELIVTGDMIFTAQFRKEKTQFFAKYIDENDRVLYRISTNDRSEALKYLDYKPTKSPSNGMQYSFYAWEKVKEEDGEFVYKAIYDSCTEGLVFNGSTLTEYRGTSKEVIIPERWDNITITTIGNNVFSFSEVKSVSFSDSISTIENNNSFNSSADVYIKIHSISNFLSMDGVTSIGQGKKHLVDTEGNLITSVTIPDAITSIHESAFCYCVDLVSIILPNTVEYIGTYAFQGCTSLASFEIPDSVTNVGNYLFDGCSSLKTVKLPSMKTNSGNKIMLPTTVERVLVGESCKTLSSYGADTAICYYGSVESWLSVSFDNTFNFESDIHLYLNGDNQETTSLTIPEGIESIPNYAFYRCVSLTEVIIPNSVTSIGNCAFNNCTSLSSITISNSVVSLGNGVFKDCKSLKSIEIPDNVVSLGSEAFCGCSALSHVDLGNGVDGLKYDTFNGCTSLKSIVVPKSVNSIAGTTFAHCTSLESMTLPFVGSSRDATGNSSVLGIIFDYPANNYANNEQRTSGGRVTTQGQYYTYQNGGKTYYSYYGYKIPQSLRHVTITDQELIPKYAFYNCDLIETFNITENTKQFGSYAFTNCNPLSDFNYRGSLNGWLEMSSKSAMIGRVHLYLDGNNVETTSLVVPDGVTEIKNAEFCRCSSLISISIPNSVTKIGSSAFYGCDSLQTLVVPNIGSSGMLSDIFGYNYIPPALETIVLTGESIKIGDKGFGSCSALKTVSILGSIDSMSYTAFDNCSAFEFNEYDNAYYVGNESNPYMCLVKAKNQTIDSCSINEQCKYICDYAFNGCTSLVEVNIPASVSKTGTYIFNGCDALESVNYRGTIDSWLALSGKNYLSKKVHLFLNGDEETTIINVPEGTTSIPSYAFVNCDWIKSVILPDGLTSVKTHAFEYCSSLESITLPESLTKIGSNAFYGCSSLESIVLPSSLTNLEFAPFAYSGLKTLYLSKNIDNVDTSAFLGVSNLEIIFTGTINDFLDLSNKDRFNGYFHLYLNNSETETTEVVIPDDVTSIGAGAFSHCPAVESIIISSSVTKIERQAFYGCASLKSIVIPDSITEIDTYHLFYDCSSLEYVVLPRSIALSSDAFNSSPIVFYEGTREDWKAVSDDSYSTYYNVYYYSEAEPPEQDPYTYPKYKYWHYVDGVPTIWE